MHYITNEIILKENLQIIENLKDNIHSESDTVLYLRALIFTEKPYLADEIKYRQSSNEIHILTEICHIFNLVLKDKLIEIPELNCNLHFEGKYHSIISLLTITLYNYFSQNH